MLEMQARPATPGEAAGLERGRAFGFDASRLVLAANLLEANR
jgi:hypothetical protein